MKQKEPVTAEGGAKKHGRKSVDAPERAVTKGTLRIGADTVPGPAERRFVEAEAERGAIAKLAEEPGLPVPAFEVPPGDSDPKRPRKERDDRSAPVGNIPAGQRDRSPD